MKDNVEGTDPLKTPVGPRGILLYDGACGFCRAWIDRWQDFTGTAVEYQPYQRAAARFPQVAPSTFAQAVHLIESDGSVSRGAAAVFRALALGGRTWPLALYRALPPVRWLCDGLYCAVARHRGAASWLTALFYGESAGASSFALANHVGLRALGLLYFIALVSYAVQAAGLIGHDGILPFADWLQAIRPQAASAGYWRLPTLLWLHPSDPALYALFALGVLFSVLLMAGVLPLLSTFSLWLIYLSVTVVGRTFLGFQWDNLLLETGLLAVLLAPWRWRLRWGRDPAPPRFAVFLLHWLIFRLMFCSGYVKLASRDASWWHLTALTYHYWTQPLPTWTAWFANLLPLWFQRLSCFLLFVVELGFPFLLWLPRRARHFAAAGFAVLMLLIMGTGNYTYFNLLTLVLLAWLVDDRVWSRWRTSSANAQRAPPAAALHRWAVVVPGLAILLVSVVVLCGTLRAHVPWPREVAYLFCRVEPFRSVNGYGLFAAMTKTRPEIVIEGSPDGENWFAYEFKWKPGDLTRRPRFVAPHQPRLDWQMWFAALGSREGNPWFMNLMARLLENSPDVVALLGNNPFPEKPPVAVRAVLYHYRFTTWAERRATGAWWVREPKGLYCPPVTLHHSRGDAT